MLLATAALDGYIREQRLRAEIPKLQIEVDKSHGASHVAEITDTHYFKALQGKAKEMCSQRRDG